VALRGELRRHAAPPHHERAERRPADAAGGEQDVRRLFGEPEHERPPPRHHPVEHRAQRAPVSQHRAERAHAGDGQPAWVAGGEAVAHLLDAGQREHRDHEDREEHEQPRDARERRAGGGGRVDVGDGRGGHGLGMSCSGAGMSVTRCVERTGEQIFRLCRER
jgi:hypothetical protein